MHHDVRLAQSLAAVEGGAGRLGRRPRAAVDPASAQARELDPFDAVLAAFETLAHLELLAARGHSAAPRTTGPSASVLSHPRHRRCLMGMTTTHLSSTDASNDTDAARRERIRVPLKTPSGILGRIVTWYSRRSSGDVPDTL